jgi:type IV pilus assembly protein PilV
MNTPSAPPRPATQRGLTLIEVLIAALVLAIGLLGLASLQAISMQFNRGALLRTQATILAYEITDAMRANRQQALVGTYGAPPNGRTYDSGSCPEESQSDIAQDDLHGWCERLTRQLPAGAATIAVANDGAAEVRIRWESLRDSTCEDDECEFTFETIL